MVKRIAEKVNLLHEEQMAIVVLEKILKDKKMFVGFLEDELKGGNGK